MKDVVEKVAATVAVGATPTVSVATVGGLTGLSGGAAVMKTLAIAGSLVGGGSVAGIVVVGAASAGVGYGAYRLVKKLKDQRNK